VDVVEVENYVCMYARGGVLKARYGTQSPGPMVYGARTTFGPQAASKNRTAPVINFTKGLRERVLYITFQCIHVKELYKYILFIYLFIYLLKFHW
jgi:hypothetical protein